MELVISKDIVTKICMEANLEGFDQFRLGLLVRSGGAGGENWTVCRSIFSFYAQKKTQKNNYLNCSFQEKNNFRNKEFILW